MTGDNGKFLNLTEYKGGKIMVTANNTKLPITHVRKAICMPQLSIREAQLQDVYHVPGMKKNLLSVSQLIEISDFFVFGPDEIKAYRSKKFPDLLIMEG
ncbi:hypothetical protein AMTR_s00040p00220470 [Amborella trichopoda]|uniref:Retrovirus-related Pol polyprotein from transposon TNT 1-94-like beta-barrel domain-containing protein n=1 Tax=Amborella trichopoda TaxID=13333 RepID=W1PYQ2_AMBTC|nr:hypothetical protein AMTR_s00040p00220470 [Amborella trichopoda]